MPKNNIKNFEYEVEITNFPTHVPISHKRRAVYYTDKAHIPIKYLSERYKMKDGKLYDTQEKAFVIKNERTAGKPRMHKVAGQDIWSNINFNLRSKIAKELKKYFYNSLRNLPKLEDENLYPIGIRIDIYDNIEGEDLDNQIYWYRKTIHDALCGNVEFSKDENGNYVPNRKKYPPIIIDDSKKYVQDIPTRFYQIDNKEERKMVVSLYKINNHDERRVLHR